MVRSKCRQVKVADCQTVIRGIGPIYDEHPAIVRQGETNSFSNHTIGVAELFGVGEQLMTARRAFPTIRLENAFSLRRLRIDRVLNGGAD